MTRRRRALGRVPREHGEQAARDPRMIACQVAVGEVVRSGEVVIGLRNAFNEDVVVRLPVKLARMLARELLHSATRAELAAGEPVKRRGAETSP